MGILTWGKVSLSDMPCASIAEQQGLTVLPMGLWGRGRLDPGQNCSRAVKGYDLKYFVCELACCLYAVVMLLCVAPGACQV